MHTHNLLPPPRLVASGGPVTRAIVVCREDAIEAERERIVELRLAIRERIDADAQLIHQLTDRLVQLTGGAA